MHSRTLALLSLLLAACSTTPELVPERGFALDLHFGQLQLDDSDWEPVEDQSTGSVSVDWGESPTGLRWEVAVSGSTDDFNETQVGSTLDGMGMPVPIDVEVDIDSRTKEFSAGARYVFKGARRFRPYIGAGLAWLEGQIEANPPDGFGLERENSDDSDIGVYLQAGGFYDFGEGLRAGLAYRALIGPELTVAGTDLDADYGRLTIFIGFSF